jgi:hypothetical protein
MTRSKASGASSFRKAWNLFGRRRQADQVEGGAPDEGALVCGGRRFQALFLQGRQHKGVDRERNRVRARSGGRGEEEEGRENAVHVSFSATCKFRS